MANSEKELSTEEIDRVVAGKAEAAYQRAQIALENIDYRLAMEHAERANLHIPDEWRYSELVGIIAEKLGEHDKAIEYYKQALKSCVATCEDGHSGAATTRNNLLRNFLPKKKIKMKKNLKYFLLWSFSAFVLGPLLYEAVKKFS